MKLLRFAGIALGLCMSTSAIGQTQSTEGDKEVWLFTAKERDSMQIWFYNRVTDMGLSDNIREEYYHIILYHSYKMARLDDTDKGYAPEEVRAKFDALLLKQHKEVRAILSEEQYTIYLKTYDHLLKGVFDRKGWK
ncbi:MAG: hypothetical protein WBG90_14925 [Saonia sp.]